MSPKFVRGGERPKGQPGEIIELRPFELHGTPYFVVMFRLDFDPEHPREARLSFDMIYPEPQAGDRVLVEQVLGVVDRMTKVAR